MGSIGRYTQELPFKCFVWWKGFALPKSGCKLACRLGATRVFVCSDFVASPIRLDHLQCFALLEPFHNSGRPTLNLQLPSFVPHPLLRGGNAQTLAAALLPARGIEYRAAQRLVPLPDGDQLVMHDDQPASWSPGDLVAVLAHGVGGCHGSPYMQRIAGKLNAAGVRVLRLDLRGCGAGERYAQGGTHAGSWEDVKHAIGKVAELSPGSPIKLAGFSLGGALALNLAARTDPQQPLPGGGLLASVLAVCPPIDLHAVDLSFRSGAGQLYSRYFARLLWKQIRRRLRRMVDPPYVDVSKVPRDLRELDEQITAPFHGYRDAAHYYEEASVRPHLPHIKIPTQIIAAEDDPVIPVNTIVNVPRSDSVQIVTTCQGGHMGFFSTRKWAKSVGDMDRRWLDWRVVEWVTGNKEG